MRWTFEILVFLVFAGMALPIIWRMRGVSILRAALSREPQPRAGFGGAASCSEILKRVIRKGYPERQFPFYDLTQFDVLPNIMETQ